MTIEDTNKSSDIILVVEKNKKNEKLSKTNEKVNFRMDIETNAQKNIDSEMNLPNTSLVNVSDLNIVNIKSQHKVNDNKQVRNINGLEVNCTGKLKKINDNNEICKGINEPINTDYEGKIVSECAISQKQNTTTHNATNPLYSSILHNTSQSTSLLEIPWIEKISEPQKVEVKRTKILPAFHDPIFLDYVFKIPKPLQKILDIAKNVNFTYEYSDNDFFEIYKNKNVVKTIDLICYGDDLKTSNSIIFFVDHLKFVKTENKNEDKRYKESLVAKTKYKPKNVVQCYRRKVHAHQIKNRVNVFYLEDYDDLLCTLKSIVSEIEKPKKYIQKVKTFSENKKKEYCEYVIASVPGISKNVANAISMYFESFSKFYTFLTNNFDKVADLIVYSDDKKNQRKLGDKQALLLKKAFLCDVPNTII